MIRKGVSLTKQATRFLRRHLRSSSPHYSVLCNSIPKSGTHLLVQLLEPLPRVKNYDTFIASLPPRPYRFRDDKFIHRQINRIIPGELASAHLFHKNIYRNWLSEKRIIHYFIYRDPRDIALSEAMYLTYMTRWHKAHNYYRHYSKTDDERITASIEGMPDKLTCFKYENIRRRIEPFLGWLEDNDICAIRFENLVARQSESTIARMIDHFNQCTALELDRNEYIAKLRGNVDARKSRTFRAGRPGSWREVFSMEHKEMFKEIAGDLLIQLGYETTNDW